MEKQNLEKVVNQIKDTEKGISDIIVPMLKDTIQDYKKTFSKLFIVVVLLIIVLTGTIGYSLYLVYKQNVKYQEFLSQFEFGEETVYQDLDTHEGGDITNSTINSN